MQFTTLFLLVTTLAGTAMPMPTHLDNAQPHRTIRSRSSHWRRAGKGGTGTSAAPGPKSTPSAVLGTAIVTAAKSQLGLPYVWGGGGCQGSSGGGFDCSGLTQFVMCKTAGITIPRTADLQYSSSMGQHVPRAQAQPGDMIFWAEGGDCKNGVAHVGIYTGPGMMINAPHTGAQVRNQAIWTSSGGESICPDAVRFSKGASHGR